MLMIFVLPKMMENMDPEALQEMQQQQKQQPKLEMPDVGSFMANMFAPPPANEVPAISTSKATKKRK